MNVIDAQLNYWDTSLQFQREVSCFITPQHGLISLTTGIIENDELVKTEGCGGAVDFDWDKIWGFLRNQETKASKVIMLHSHPTGHDVMSPTDLNMCQGWRLGLGVPIYFLITTQYVRVSEAYKIEGIITHYIVDRDENKKITISNAYKNPIDIYPLDLKIVAKIVYGMSKAEDLSHEDVAKIEKELKQSKLQF
jgi:hypothetical protein